VPDTERIHYGAPLEPLGQLASVALAATDVTRPIGRIGDGHSQGIKDLRHGLKKGAARSGRTPQPPDGVVMRFVAGSLGDTSDGLVGQLVGTVFGDGLVRYDSAVDAGLGGDVQRIEVAGVGHMALVNQPRGHEAIRAWLGATDAR
jgi:hypothetical protein